MRVYSANITVLISFLFGCVQVFCSRKVSQFHPFARKSEQKLNDMTLRSQCAASKMCHSRIVSTRQNVNNLLKPKTTQIVDNRLETHSFQAVTP